MAGLTHPAGCGVSNRAMQGTTSDIIAAISGYHTARHAPRLVILQAIYTWQHEFARRLPVNQSYSIEIMHPPGRVNVKGNVS